MEAGSLKFGTHIYMLFPKLFCGIVVFLVVILREVPLSE